MGSRGACSGCSRSRRGVSLRSGAAVLDVRVDYDEDSDTLRVVCALKTDEPTACEESSPGVWVTRAERTGEMSALTVRNATRRGQPSPAELLEAFGYAVA